MLGLIDRHSTLGIILTIIQILAMIGFWISIALAFKGLRAISRLENKHKNLDESKKEKCPSKIAYCPRILNQFFCLFRDFVALFFRFFCKKDKKMGHLN